MFQEFDEAEVKYVEVLGENKQKENKYLEKYLCRRNF